LQYFYRGEAILPVSVKGFFVGTGGALVVLTFYKVMGSYGLQESDTSFFRHQSRRRRRRRYSGVVEE